MDLDGQCQGRTEGEKQRFDQDWQGDHKQRGLEESCKSLIVRSLGKERKKEKIGLGISFSVCQKTRILVICDLLTV